MRVSLDDRHHGIVRRNGLSSYSGDSVTDEGSGIWICTGTGVRYYARVRWHGYQKYQLVGNPTKSYHVALVRLAREFATGKYKRGDVLMSSDYYEPIPVCELVRT